MLTSTHKVPTDFLNNTNYKHNQVSFKGTLDNLEPQKVFGIFEEITKLYKESEHNEEISNYISKKLKHSNFDVQVKGPESGKGQYTIVATRNVDKKRIMQ